MTTTTVVPHQAQTATADLSGTSAVVWDTIDEADLTKFRDLSLTINAGTQGRDVSFVFTNTSTVPAGVDLSGVMTRGLSGTTQKSPDSSLEPLSSWQVADQALRARDREVIEQWRSGRLTGPSSQQTPRAVYASPSVGDTFLFQSTSAPYDGTPSVRATLRSKVGGTSAYTNQRTLLVWVADDVWDGNGDGKPDAAVPGATHGVSQAMVQAYGQRFLNAQKADVYTWITTIFGKEWTDAGTSPGSGLIDGHGEIHIIFRKSELSGAAGYFEASANFVDDGLKDWTQYSPQRLLFVLDADYSADPVGGASDTVWSIDDPHSAFIISTLAHEFQHMIQFYQKSVVHNVGDSDSWINEMSSMVAEDLVADKLATPGPRGVALDASGKFRYGTGDVETNWGRLNTFLPVHSTVGLTGWEVLDSRSYANAYAFGAWLVRNYGGPGLFREIVQSARLDWRAVVESVNTVNQTNETFGSLVRAWGLATFLQNVWGNSDPVNYGFDPNQGGKRDWTIGGRVYSLGSIDLGLYRWYVGKVPYQGVPVAGPDESPPALAGGASWFQHRWSAVTGTKTVALTLPPGVVLTVVGR